MLARPVLSDCQVIAVWGRFSGNTLKATWSQPGDDGKWVYPCMLGVCFQPVLSEVSFTRLTSAGRIGAMNTTMGFGA